MLSYVTFYNHPQGDLEAISSIITGTWECEGDSGYTEHLEGQVGGYIDVLNEQNTNEVE